MHEKSKFEEYIKRLKCFSYLSSFLLSGNLKQNIRLILYRVAPNVNEQSKIYEVRQSVLFVLSNCPKSIFQSWFKKQTVSVLSRRGHCTEVEKLHWIPNIGRQGFLISFNATSFNTWRQHHLRRTKYFPNILELWSWVISSEKYILINVKISLKKGIFHALLKLYACFWPLLTKLASTVTLLTFFHLKYIDSNFLPS